MARASQIDNHIMNQIKEISEFIDHSTFDRIINKLTDYAEILTEKKLSGIINFNFNLNRSQIDNVIDLLHNIQAISIIHLIALKASKDLENEYLSNIVSSINNIEKNSSYVNLRNIIENRLTHQIQQYNMNMLKSNTTLPMNVNELRGHITSYNDMLNSELSISAKVQHGCVSASLHDAYIIIMDKPSWWNDLTYLKYFSNDANSEKRKHLLVSKNIKLNLGEIEDGIKEVSNRLSELNLIDSHSNDEPKEEIKIKNVKPEKKPKKQPEKDKLLSTPFGKQYGPKIDLIITSIFDPGKRENMKGIDDDWIKNKMLSFFEKYTKSKKEIAAKEYLDDITNTVDFLMTQNIILKNFTKKYIHSNKNEPFEIFFSETNKELIENFIIDFIGIYFENKFSSIFRIIKSQDMKKHACAYIIKRIYLTQGEELKTFGYYLIRTIAKIGKIKI